MKLLYLLIIEYIYLVVVVGVENVENMNKVFIPLSFIEIIVVKKFPYLRIDILSSFIKQKFFTVLTNF